MVALMDWGRELTQACRGGGGDDVCCSSCSGEEGRRSIPQILVPVSLANALHRKRKGVEKPLYNPLYLH